MTEREQQADAAKMFMELLAGRSDADYSPAAKFSPGFADSAVSKAESFVAAMRRLLPPGAA